MVGRYNLDFVFGINLGCLLDIQRETSSRQLFKALEFRGEGWARDTNWKVLIL